MKYLLKMRFIHFTLIEIEKYAFKLIIATIYLSFVKWKVSYEDDLLRIKYHPY